MTIAPELAIQGSILLLGIAGVYWKLANKIDSHIQTNAATATALEELNRVKAESVAMMVEERSKAVSLMVEQRAQALSLVMAERDARISSDTARLQETVDKLSAKILNGQFVRRDECVHCSAKRED